MGMSSQRGTNASISADENVGYLQQLHGVEVATQQGDLDQHEGDVHDKGPRANGERGEI